MTTDIDNMDGDEKTIGDLSNGSGVHSIRYGTGRPGYRRPRVGETGGSVRPEDSVQPWRTATGGVNDG